MTRVQWIAFWLVWLLGIALLGVVVYMALPASFGFAPRLVLSGFLAVVIWRAAGRLAQID
jgi:hypothetical protein